MGGSRCIIFLLRARFRKFPQHLIKKCRGFLRCHTLMPPRWPHPVVFPFLNPVPHIEAGRKCADIKLGIGFQQRRHDRLCPGPICARQIIGNFSCLTRCWVMAIAQSLQKFIRYEMQGVEIAGQGIKGK